VKALRPLFEYLFGDILAFLRIYNEPCYPGMGLLSMALYSILRVTVVFLLG
jgi:hypothetical protein